MSVSNQLFSTPFRTPNSHFDTITYPQYTTLPTTDLFCKLLKFPYINNKLYKMGTGNLRYYNRVFYSYNEPIAFCMVTNNELDFVVVLGKTALFGSFYSKTTSNHIGKLINCIDYHNINYIVVGAETLLPIRELNNRYKKVTPPSMELEVVESSEMCSICLDQDTNANCKLSCNHIFHSDCIHNWFGVKGSNECPLCKQIHSHSHDLKSYIEARVDTDRFNIVFHTTVPLIQNPYLNF